MEVSIFWSSCALLSCLVTLAFGLLLTFGPHTYFSCVSQDSESDIIGAIVEILHQKNGAIVTMAADLVVKLVNVFTYSTLQPYVLELIHPLSSLSANHPLQVAKSCTRALNLLIFNLSKAKEKEVWEILNETDAITHLVGNIVDFPCVTKSVEHIQEMASLLGIILWRFPQSRYPVWDNSRLMEFLEIARADPNPSIKVVFLKLCYAIGNFFMSGFFPAVCILGIDLCTEPLLVHFDSAMWLWR